MPMFRKTILPVGEYLVTRPNGTRMLKKFDADYLREVAKNATKMIKAGLRIPAPFRHVEEAVPVEEAPETNSFDNAGYWSKIEFEMNEDGQEGLIGFLEAPGNVDDMTTPAGKIAHTIKEVSACIVDAWKDGANRDWGPSMLHGAPVINPVVPGQKEFSLLSIPGEAYVLSASGIVDQSPSADNIAELSKALEESAGIYLPAGTLLADLPKVLMVSLKQHKMTADQTVEDQEIIDTQSIFMSLPQGQLMPFTKAQAEELVGLGLLDPKTNEPITLDSLPVDDSPSPEHQYALALTAQLTEEKKNGLRKRVTDLISTGRTTQEHADSALFPQIDKYELSLGEGATFKPTTIDMLVGSLEALPVAQTPPASNPDPSLMSSGVPGGQSSHDGNPNPETPISEEQAEGMKKAMLEQLAF